jgi:O-antigen ligase
MNSAGARRTDPFTASAALDARTIERLAPASLTLILLYAGCLAVGNGPGNVLLAFLALSALPIVALRPELRSRPVLIFSLLVILYLLAMAIRAELQGAPGRHLRAVDNYAFFAFAPFVAVHVAIALRYSLAFERLCLLAIAVLVAGAAARLFWNADWGAGLSLFDRYQWGAGGGNRNYLSIEAGLTVLASGSLLVLAVAGGRWRWPARLIGGGILACVCALAFLALLEMKSRNNWVALGAAGMVWLATLVIGSARRSGPRRSGLRATSLVFFGAVVAGLIAFSGQIETRFSDNGGLTGNIEVFVRILTGALDRSSVELQAYDPRVYLFVTARELIAMKPWFGWGTDVGPLVAQHVGVKSLEGMIHFHNAYLELLVGLGFAGTGLLAGHLAAVAFASRARASPPLDPDAGPLLRALLAASLTYIGLVALAESANRVELVTQTLILIFALLLGRAGIGRAVDRIAGPGGRPQ